MNVKLWYHNLRVKDNNFTVNIGQVDGPIFFF